MKKYKISNRNFVCFDCKNSVRKSPYFFEHVFCSLCGKKMIPLSDEISLPARKKELAWKNLEKQVSLGLKTENNKVNLKSKKHQLEKEAKRLEEYLLDDNHPYIAKKYQRQLEKINVEIEKINQKLK